MVAVDPDSIARGISPSAPEQAAVQAGREAIRLQNLYLAAGRTFIITMRYAVSMV